ncbi:sugar-binding domain-containing protein [Pedobacter sp. L105]|uniref:sugar-binding domain-containing protein n=1 Tax=Pedobacter sp. L105 TaxID=1641871 RepID=UPI00131B7FCD|nr:sugar-binding domain-containing protein [Pedobacter sp. L105]
MKKICILLSHIVLFIFATSVNGQSILQPEINLSGKWLFSRDEAKAGLIEKWYGDKLKPMGSGPSEIALPGTTAEAKAGLPNSRKPTLEGLYQPNVYIGPAWYQREIEIPGSWKGKHVTVFLERNHWVTHVWLDGQDYGTHDNLTAPQIYDLGINIKPGKHRLTICVDNSLKFDLGPFVSINYEGTQTNWNGIVGAIKLCATDLVTLSDVEIYPDVDHKLIKVEAHISNITGSIRKGDIRFSVTGADGAMIGKPVSVSVLAPKGEFVVKSEVPMGSHPMLWDEFSPNLYMLKTTLSTKTGGAQCEKNNSFGMRKLNIKGTQFAMNGRPLMMRGTLDCAIYPLTGYPPTDVVSWRRIFKIEKSYGLNFIRFHSWTPPEAAFTAADQEGLMIQTEGPLADINVGEDPRKDDFVKKELLNIVHTYGNHPSFCLMTIGNEFGGPDKILKEWVDTLIKSDSRHLYSSAACAQVTSNRQWTEDVTGRGIYGPNTMHDAKEAIHPDTPMIGHEIGQWTFYPDFHEISKYTGVLRADNFKLVRDQLQANGMLDEADQFLQSTGSQAVLLYKEEIENLLRTPGYGGFSLLDLHDYPGQGTALVGLLDPFWDSKGFVTPEEHKRYCGPTVPLLRMPKRTYTNTETFSASAELAHFGSHDLIGAKPEWMISDQQGKIIANGSFVGINVVTGKLTELGKINAALNKITAPGKFKVTVSLKNTSIVNTWDIWVYPDTQPATLPNNVILRHSWDEGTRMALAEGKRVVLLPSIDSARSLKGSFLPVFWSPIWFHNNPNTMGILCDPKNPLFSLFPTDEYSNWQWWKLIQGSQTMILNNTSASFRPLIQVIDNFARNNKLGNVFEARVGKGTLLVCTLNLRDENLPETRAFLKSLYRYVSSDSFKPTQSLNISTLGEILSQSTSKK